MSSVEITKKDFIRSLTDAITSKKVGGRLTPRDYEILRFILAVIFADPQFSIAEQDEKLSIQDGLHRF